MNIKIKKVIKEIDVTKQKISELQQKLEELNKYKIELENIEIINFFRQSRISTYDISEIMEEFKSFHQKSGMPILTPKEEDETNDEI